MQIREVLDLVSDELRDGKATKYSRTSLMVKLKEGVTQFVQESKILKNSILIRPVPSQGVYSLPVFGTDIKVISTSEIKISVLLERKYLELAIQALHEAFELNKVWINDSAK